MRFFDHLVVAYFFGPPFCDKFCAESRSEIILKIDQYFAKLST